MANPLAKMFDPPEGEKDAKYWYNYLVNAKLDPELSQTLLKNFDLVLSTDQQVKFMLKRMKKLGISLDLELVRVKNDDRAEALRDTANDVLIYSGDQTENAIVYTESIAYATPKSRALALAYANRSTVAFKAGRYEDCLEDIERALAIDYPEELKARLYSRRLRCYATLHKPKALIDKALADTKKALPKFAKNADGRNVIEKVLNDPDHLALFHIPHKCPKWKRIEIKDRTCDIRGATGITIKYNKRYGKHLVATRDIKPGEIIAVTESYGKTRSLLKTYRECSECVKGTLTAIPCDYCVNVVYCGIACRDKAWKLYHRTECPVLGTLLELGMPTNGILLVRLALRALQEAGGIVELKEMLDKLDSITDQRLVGYTDGIFDCSTYPSCYSLTCHTNKKKRMHEYYGILMGIYSVYYLATMSDVFGERYEGGLEIFEKNPLMFFFAGLVSRMGTAVQMSSGDETVPQGHHDAFLSAFVGLVNHGCNANVAIMGKYNRSLTFALAPIKAGEQLFNNYLNMYWWQTPKAERQAVLREEYNFECKCAACVEDWPLRNALRSVSDVIDDEGVSKIIIAQLAYETSAEIGKNTGNYAGALTDLAKLIETTRKYGCPLRELVDYQEMLVELMLVSCPFVDGP